MSYNPKNWYWIASDGRLFSSARQSLIQSNDATYTSWLATPGNFATIWPSDDTGVQSTAALQEVLAPYGLSVDLSTALIAYATSKQAALRDGGITVNVGTASTPDEVNVASDVNGRSLVSGSVQLIGLASSSGQLAPTFNWINDGGTQLTLTSTQMMNIGLTLGNFVQATYTALGTVLAAIANGTITTTSAIDSAAWPTTSY